MGYVIAIIMFVSSAMSVWFFNKNQTMTAASMSHSETDAVINHIKIYANSIENFIKNHPSYHGQVMDKQLMLPSWFTGDRRIKKHIFLGRGYLYIPTKPGLLGALNQALHGSLLLGTVKNKKMIYFTEGKSEISLPAEIPDGSIVYVI